MAAAHHCWHIKIALPRVVSHVHQAMVLPGELRDLDVYVRIVGRHEDHERLCEQSRTHSVLGPQNGPTTDDKTAFALELEADRQELNVFHTYSPCHCVGGGGAA